MRGFLSCIVSNTDALCWPPSAVFAKIDWEKFVSSEKSCIFAEKMEGYEKALYQ